VSGAFRRLKFWGDNQVARWGSGERKFTGAFLLHKSSNIVPGSQQSWETYQRGYGVSYHFQSRRFATLRILAKKRIPKLSCQTWTRSRVTNYNCSPSAPILVSTLDPDSQTQGSPAPSFESKSAEQNAKDRKANALRSCICCRTGARTVSVSN
jgi:hypothetical protein